MKIGCISWSHRNEFSDGTMDLFQWMEHCKKDCKLDGVELWNNHMASLEEDYLQKIKDKAEELELPVYSVATKCMFGKFGKEEVEHAKQVMRDWLKATDFLGAKIMRISIGGESLREPSHQESVFGALTEVIEEDKYPHIAVGIENQEPGVVQNIDDVRKMTSVSKGLLKVVLDNGSFINKSDSYSFMEEALPAAAVVHAKFFDIREDGSDKILDYEKIRQILKKSDYDGYVSIEYDSMEPASKDVPKIAAYLKKILLEVE